MKWLETWLSGTNWSEALVILERMVKITAIVVGGVWTYLRFIRGRIYRPRLRPSVEGRVILLNGQPHLVVTLTIENVGSSKVDLSQEGTGLRLFTPTMQPPAPPPDLAAWVRLGTFAVFEKHGWIENGEVIQDQVVITLPEGIAALRLEFRVVARKIEWQSTATVEIEA